MDVYIYIFLKLYKADRSVHAHGGMQYDMWSWWREGLEAVEISQLENPLSTLVETVSGHLLLMLETLTSTIRVGKFLAMYVDGRNDGRNPATTWGLMISLFT